MITEKWCCGISIPHNHYTIVTATPESSIQSFMLTGSCYLARSLIIINYYNLLVYLKHITTAVYNIYNTHSQHSC